MKISHNYDGLHCPIGLASLSFNDIHPMTVVSTFSVSHFHMFADLVSLTHLALIILTHLAELVSLTHLALGCLTHLADLLLTHLALISHI